MPFVIQSSTIPGAIGAGAGGKEIHFNDFTHQLTFKGSDGKLAVALATFGDGDELKQAKLWAERAWGLTSVEIEPYDAEAEADKRQRQTDEEAAAREAANTEAKRILLDAKDAAAKLLTDAQAQADKTLKAAADQADATVEVAKDHLAKAKEEREKAAQLVKDAKAKT